MERREQRRQATVAEPAEGRKYHVKTFIRPADDDEEPGWYCVCDIGEVLAEVGGATLEEVRPLVVGPWPSRQVAKKELRGPFHKIITEAVQSFTKRAEGKIVSLRFNDSRDRTN